MYPTTQKIRHTLILGGILVLLSATFAPLTHATDTESAVTHQTEEAKSSSSSFPKSAGLTGVITMVCNDALERFHGFYGSSEVTVEPFRTLGFYEGNKQSELGMTLADQMTAIINNDTRTRHKPTPGKLTQKLTGVLQELDGYLRIHISGVNAIGKRTSFVVNVEMSEPIYRALHTYL